MSQRNAQYFKQNIYLFIYLDRVSIKKDLKDKTIPLHLWHDNIYMCLSALICIHQAIFASAMHSQTDTL